MRWDHGHYGQCVTSLLPSVLSPPASCQQQQSTTEPEPECEQHEDCEQLRQLQLDADTADRLQLRTEDQFCCYDLSDLQRASRAVAAKRCCAEMEAVIMPPSRDNLTQVEMKQVSVSVSVQPIPIPRYISV